MTHVIEARMDQNSLCFIYDYPVEQASLARIRPGEPSVAERFELYVRGVELANGFHELTDSASNDSASSRTMSTAAPVGYR